MVKPTGGLPDAVMPSLSPLSHRAPKSDHCIKYKSDHLYIKVTGEWHSCLTDEHKKDQSCILVFPSVLLLAVRRCQRTMGCLGSIWSSTEQAYGRKLIIGTGCSSFWVVFRTRHEVHPEQVHSQWRISPSLTVLGHLYPETGLVSALCSSCIPSVLKQSFSFHCLSLSHNYIKISAELGWHLSHSL